MGDINCFRADLEKEKHGTWIPGPGGVSFKIACMDNNPAFKEALESAVERRKVLLNTKELSEEQRVSALYEAVARTILVDWKDLHENGQPVPYSVEKAWEWFNDPEMWRLPSFIMAEAQKESNFRKELLAEQVKN